MSPHGTSASWSDVDVRRTWGREDVSVVWERRRDHVGVGGSHKAREDDAECPFESSKSEQLAAQKK